jgi:hypothetical protein
MAETPNSYMACCVEDPTILSGTVRSTLDVFDEYEDAEIVGFRYVSRSLTIADYLCEVRGSASCPSDSLQGCFR